jgi:hypothetical protein
MNFKSLATSGDERTISERRENTESEITQQKYELPQLFSFIENTF